MSNIKPFNFAVNNENMALHNFVITSSTSLETLPLYTICDHIKAGLYSCKLCMDHKDLDLTVCMVIKDPIQVMFVCVLIDLMVL